MRNKVADEILEALGSQFHCKCTLCVEQRRAIIAARLTAPSIPPEFKEALEARDLSNHMNPCGSFIDFLHQVVDGSSELADDQSILLRGYIGGVDLDVDNNKWLGSVARCRLGNLRRIMELVILYDQACDIAIADPERIVVTKPPIAAPVKHYWQCDNCHEVAFVEGDVCGRCEARAMKYKEVDEPLKRAEPIKLSEEELASLKEHFRKKHTGPNASQPTEPDGPTESTTSRMVESLIADMDEAEHRAFGSGDEKNQPDSPPRPSEIVKRIAELGGEWMPQALVTDGHTDSFDYVKVSRLVDAGLIINELLGYLEGKDITEPFCSECSHNHSLQEPCPTKLAAKPSFGASEQIAQLRAEVKELKHKLAAEQGRRAESLRDAAKWRHEMREACDWVDQRDETIKELKAKLAANEKTIELALIASRRANEVLDGKSK